MSTIDVKDAANVTQTIERPLAPGRAAAASSRPVALSTEDKTSLDAVGTKLDSLITANTDTSTVNVAQDTATVKNGATSLTPKFKKIDLTADTDIIALVTGKKLRILALALMADAADIVQFWSNGTSGTKICGPLPLAANGGLVLPFNPVGWFETVAGEKLTLDVSTGAAVGGILTYIEV